MKRSTLIAFSLLAASALAQAQNVDKLPADIERQTKSLNAAYLVFTPEEDSDEALPLVIYLHGAGGVGEEIRKITGQTRPLWQGIGKFAKTPCIMVAPQCDKRFREGGGWNPADLNLFLNHVQAKYEIDEKRIYLTGNSMGGYGTWLWAASNPEHFAAAAPISGGLGAAGPKDVTPDWDKWVANLTKVPIYAFAGAKDRVVPVERSQRAIAAIEKAGGEQAKLKVYPDEGHNARRIVFTTAEFYEWMFAQRQE